jgi:thymidylate synthase
MEPSIFIGGSIGEAWDHLLFDLRHVGKDVAPQGRLTKEHTGVTVHVNNSRNNVLVNSGRDLNYRFMVAEWMWISLGLDDVATIARYNKEIAKFSDDGERMAGAYGPRLYRQLGFILNKLQEDKDTRQAVLELWQANPPKSKDIPCTLTLQFLYRSGRLDLIVNMRSSDVWLGLPYDFFTFSMILNMVAAEMAWVAGSVTMHLGSSHLYEINWDAADVAMRTYKSYTMESPALTSYLPNSLKDVLRDPNNPHHISYEEPWSLYKNVLATATKVQSLGAMKVIDAYCKAAPR